MQEKSDVEKYWDAIRAKAGSNQPDWHGLHPIQQQLIISSINQLLQALTFEVHSQGA